MLGEHRKIVKDLDQKKLLHVLHKRFRESDRQRLQEEENGKRLEESSFSPNATASSSLGSTFSASQSSPQLQTVQSIIEDIKFHSKSQRLHKSTLSRSSFSNILATARRQVSTLSFSPLRHKKTWIRTGAAHFPPEMHERDSRDVSSHFVGEFGDQWFERDKDGLQTFLTSPTKSRTRMTREEFFEACVVSTTEKSKRRPQPHSHQQQHQIEGEPQTTQSSEETSISWSDPHADGRQQVYETLVSADDQTNCVIKRKAWKLLRSDSKARPILDACPLLAPLAGRPAPLWSGATSHDRPLPRNKITCNSESRLAIKSMKIASARLAKEIKERTALGAVPLSQVALKQNAVSAEVFFDREMKRVRRETPSVLRKERNDIEQRRLADLAARKTQKLQKQAEAKKMQDEKAAKQAKATELMKSRPGTALAELSPEEQRVEAAKIIQRVIMNTLTRKRYEAKKTQDETGLES